MPLIACPDCGSQVSDLAPACIQCGRPIAAAAPVPVPFTTRNVRARSGVADGIKIGFGMFVLLPILMIAGCFACAALVLTSSK